MTSEVFRIGVNGLLVGAANTAPTATTATVTTTEEVSHTFTAANFNFADPDRDFLASVKIVAPPALAKGRLTLDGVQVTANQVVTKADLGANKLRFTPATNGFGSPYTTFTFKVSDGEAESAEATMNVNVTGTNDPATGAPTISGTLRVGATLTAVTTGIMDVDGLTSPTYMYQWILVYYYMGAKHHSPFRGRYRPRTCWWIWMTASRSRSGDLHRQLDNTETRTSAATAVAGRENNPATGTPTISGTATVGEVLTAATTGIADRDGLPSSFNYQWVRVDGTETDITGADAATYTLDTADAGKKIKVKVSFGDDRGNPETRTSAAYPPSGTIVDPNSDPNTAPTASDAMVTTNEDTPHTFTAAEFNFGLGRRYAGERQGGDAAGGGQAGAQRDPSDNGPVGPGGEHRHSGVHAGGERQRQSLHDLHLQGERRGGESAVATMTVNVTAVNDPATGAPTISGTAEVGRC